MELVFRARLKTTRVAPMVETPFWAVAAEADLLPDQLVVLKPERVAAVLALLPIRWLAAEAAPQAAASLRRSEIHPLRTRMSSDQVEPVELLARAETLAEQEATVFS